MKFKLREKPQTRGIELIEQIYRKWANIGYHRSRACDIICEIFSKTKDFEISNFNFENLSEINVEDPDVRKDWAMAREILCDIFSQAEVYEAEIARVKNEMEGSRVTN